MSYTNKTISEILTSVEKIGIAKTARLYNIGTTTINRWLKNKKNLPKEKKLKKNLMKSGFRKFVLRRIHLENSDIDCFIYNLKDLYTEFCKFQAKRIPLFQLKSVPPDYKKIMLLCCI